MTRAALAAAAVATLLAPPSAAAFTDNWIGIAAPKAVKAGKAFTLKASASFDSRLYAPPAAYLAAGVWRRSGDEPCLKAVPMDRRGYTEVRRHDFYPTGTSADDYSVEFLVERLRLKSPGEYRWCGYVYTTEYDARANPSYHPKARTTALTRVGR